MRLSLASTMLSRSAGLGLLLLMAIGLVGCAGSPGISGAGGATSSYPPASVDSSPEAARLWQVFKRYEGAPYRYGGTTAAGFDCSGFIVTAYDEALNRQLPRTTSRMMKAGTPVTRDRLRPGDLVFFHTGFKERHAGIYIGEGRFMHSSSSVGVSLSSLEGYYWRDRFTQARRYD